jgi:hypothetical protein
MKYLSKHFVSDGVDFLVLEPEDCTQEQWQALLDIFGLVEAERIKITEYKIEAYGVEKKGE